MQRFHSIDILRGLAILLMIQVHFVENLTPREASSAWLYDASEFLGAFAAPLFTFVSGLSFFLWARKNDSQGNRDTTAIAVRRGVFLFVVGIAFNVAVWLPEDVFNWDILTLIGTSLIVLAAARSIPPAALVLACAVILLISPLARNLCDYRAYWDDGAFTYDFNARDIFFGYLVNGYFPLLPWLVFPLTGFLAAGPILLRRRSDWSTGRLATLGMGLAAAAALVAGVGAVVRRYADGFSEFPASTCFMLGMLGVCLVSTLLLNQWFDLAETTEESRTLRFFRRYSEFSLSVYLVHHMVILWPMWAYAIWTREADPTAYWRRAMSTPLALALALVFIVVCFKALGVLEVYKKYSIESLMRRICG